MALGDYFHVRHLVDGRVDVPGVDLVWVQLQIEHILQRAFRYREWDVSEFSLAQYLALRSSGDDSLMAIPVFPSRVFRHGSIFVRPGELSGPEALAGRQIGVPEWVQTAGVWTRGLLADEFGVDLRSVRWVQGGLLTPGREEHVSVSMPDGVQIRAERGASLQDLLIGGEIDAIISARPPTALGVDGSITRLFADYRDRELEWGLRTRIVPIMHIVVIRREVYDQSRWIARALLDAFTEAKRAAMTLLTDLTASAVPVPWVGEEPLRYAGLFDGEWWPYGVTANRTNLEAFLRHAQAQGIAAAHLTVDELFAPETLSDVKV